MEADVDAEPAAPAGTDPPPLELLALPAELLGSIAGWLLLKPRSGLLPFILTCKTAYDLALPHLLAALSFGFQLRRLPPFAAGYLRSDESRDKLCHVRSINSLDPTVSVCLEVLQGARHLRSLVVEIGDTPRSPADRAVASQFWASLSGLDTLEHLAIRSESERVSERFWRPPPGTIFRPPSPRWTWICGAKKSARARWQSWRRCWRRQRGSGAVRAPPTPPSCSTWLPSARSPPACVVQVVAGAFAGRFRPVSGASPGPAPGRTEGRFQRRQADGAGVGARLCRGVGTAPRKRGHGSPAPGWLPPRPVLARHPAGKGAAARGPLAAPPRGHLGAARGAPRRAREATPGRRLWPGRETRGSCPRVEADRGGLCGMGSPAGRCPPPLLLGRPSAHAGVYLRQLFVALVVWLANA
ncbi:hypothetical protein DFJ74DRAFT_695100 [Hyaloraphidium curvatum]|nr:hypothetical protein DFJ74DRAFT_695100 [Hyaloraphidium curvatum]